MSKPRIAINGFGRIGRTIARINAISNNFDLVLINDKNSDIENLSYLFKYDSTFGKFEGEVANSKSKLFINHSEINYSSFENLNEINFEKFKVDILIDSSGIFGNAKKSRELISKRVIKKCIITHSNSEADIDIVMGVNDNLINENHKVLSSSICDANAIAHVLNWIDKEYGIKDGSLTTLHPWLSYQNLVDAPAMSQSISGNVWPDYALGRSSVGSVIPKNTTAMTAVENILPNLKNRILSFSYRIPTALVATSDITLNLNSQVDSKSLIAFLEQMCLDSPYVEMNSESLISLDYEKNYASAIIDKQWVKSVNNVVKLILWYDNEWAYSARVLDLVSKIAKI